MSYSSDLIISAFSDFIDDFLMKYFLKRTAKNGFYSPNYDATLTETLIL